MFNNAVASIILGIEDFDDGTDDRMLSATRNFYAGLLLLAKECLVRAAPDSDPMEVIGARFKPVTDDANGVNFKSDGYTTISFNDLEKRFRDFNLKWPKVDIKKLRKLRNDLEHFHLKEPVKVLSEAMASAFPMVVDFFNILGEDPKASLGHAWLVIIDQHQAYEKVQSSCISSLEAVNWPGPIANLDLMSCPNCGSSLISALDLESTDPDKFYATCQRCSHEFDNAESVALVVNTSFGDDAYIMAKEGMNSCIADCPDCGQIDNFVETSEVTTCYSCASSGNEPCKVCEAYISAHEFSWENNGLCNYCAHKLDKIMSE